MEGLVSKVAGKTGGRYSVLELRPGETLDTEEVALAATIAGFSDEKPTVGVGIIPFQSNSSSSVFFHEVSRLFSQP